MANAGHASFSTTKRYIKLAGVVFPDAAAARAERLLSTEASTNPGAPKRISHDLEALAEAEAEGVDAL
jgi:hypothetical protein